MYFLLEKGWVFFAIILVCWSLITSKQRPSERRFTPCMYLSQIHLMNRCWVAQHSTPICFPFQKPGRSCRRLPCGSPSAKADARCPVAVWFLAFLHAYKVFPKLEKAPTKTQPAIFSRASRAKAKKVSQMANIFFLRGVRGETWKTSLIVFVGSKKSCVFSKGFNVWKSHFQAGIFQEGLVTSLNGCRNGFSTSGYLPWRESPLFGKLSQLTLQGINISLKNGILKMIFLFPRWDMLIPWRVFYKYVSEKIKPSDSNNDNDNNNSNNYN